MATTDVQVRPRPHARSVNPDRRHTIVVGLKTSKFRHVSVKSGGKEGTFINLRQVNTRFRPESNGFCINDRWAAVPLSVAGGVIAIFDLRKPTKIADGVIPGLENGSNVADFAWYPFDENTLAVGCDNGFVNLWVIPTEGIFSAQTEPAKSFKAHNDKINVIKFNPVASDVLATSANNGEIVIWNTGASEPKIRLQPSTSPILTMAWSSDGIYLAVISRDCYLRIYDPRVSNVPLSELHVLETPRGARVLYVCNDRYLLTSSLSKSSQRMINLYSAKDLSLVHSYPLDASSSLLIPHYDFDSSVVFLTGKGDRTIHMFEICDDPPHFLQLSPFAAPTSHQAIAFSSKKAVDVRKVEFARGARLLLSELENATFTVPRVKMEFFQNDLFPPALATWEAVTDSDEWFRGADVRRKFKTLKPDDMEPLYKDMYLLDVTRYLSGQDAPGHIAAIDGERQEKRTSQMNGTLRQENKNDHCQSDGACNGASAEHKEPSVTTIKRPEDVTTTTTINVTTIKRLEDGLLLKSSPSAEVNKSTHNNMPSPKQPKRLSIDPNCGTPLRDLLRRCDEMPGVIAMREQSDTTTGSCTETCEDNEWE